MAFCEITISTKDALPLRCVHSSTKLVNGLPTTCLVLVDADCLSLEMLSTFYYF